jgi:3-isopropylmalate dehydrogenase
MKTIAIMGGDGIGPEVTRQGRRVLEWLVAHSALDVTLIDVAYGADTYQRTGHVLPDSSMAALQAADAILFGATGGPAYDTIPAADRKRGGLLTIRSRLDLFANLRPVATTPALYAASSLKDRVLEGVDLLIVRELTGGIYFGIPRGVETMHDGERRAINTHSYTESQLRRIARQAFTLARGRHNRVCSVDKANVMEAGAFWRAEVEAVHAAEFPDVTLSHMLADNCAMQLVRAPSQFDVIVTDNLFGDLLSDCAAMLTGSLGMLPSASLGPIAADGRRAALYEPVHGSAPDIAGQDKANPLATILSVAMMLKLSLGRPDLAAAVEQAVDRTLSAGWRTADIALEGERQTGTAAMGDAVLQHLATTAV